MEASPVIPPERGLRRLHRFPGGLKLEDHKALSTSRPIEPLPLPSLLVVPLAQHIGAKARPRVVAGQRVLKGEPIGSAEGGVSCGVHAPTSGRVVAVEPRPVPHPSGLPDLCVVIEPDGEERWIERRPIDYLDADPREVRNRLREAGLVGLGGAVFPSYVKLSPGTNTVRTLVVNGAECEPYITCDEMLMRSHAAEIVAGIEIARHLLGAVEVLIGVEDNKPEAIAAMTAVVSAAGHPFEIVPVPPLYPAGGEKQLLYTLTGREVPSGKRPQDIGIVCFNVGTLYALARAVLHGEPLISRVTTVTGNVEAPRNVEALIGTPVAHLLAAARPRSDTDALIMGGPMMGFVLPGPEVPVVKATNCIIARSPALLPPPPPPMPCIRCGRCAEVCPVRLAPMELYAFAKSRNFGKAQEYALFDCIECGCCSAVCPSHIPLVDFYRYAKSEIWARERERKAADLARRRHEFRLARLAREQEERARRLAEKAGKAGQAVPDREAIRAIIEQAKAKKAQASSHPMNAPSSGEAQ